MSWSNTGSLTAGLDASFELDSADAAMSLGHVDRYEVRRHLGAGGLGVVVEAYDPIMERSVALKLLRPHHHRGAGANTRFLAEMHQLKLVAHPHVVAVYEIGSTDLQTYVAMELVSGTTLRAWLTERPRRWRKIVDLFVAAGRGLAAIHAAGLVHRDFKPANVLIDADHRARVCDVGLVGDTTHNELAADDREIAEPEPMDDDATRGTMAGTPAYTSAEAWDGRLVDALSDQFAFCASLWEALCGHPFPGTRAEIRAAVLAGQIAEPRPARGVPPKLLAIVRRGLAADPDARWPDMTALLDAIKHQLRIQTVAAIAATTGIVAVAAAGVAFTVTTVRSTHDPCEPPTALLQAAWSPAHAESLRARFTALDPAQGMNRFVWTAAALDTRSRAWSAMHVAACRATQVDGVQTEALLALRMACLERSRRELATTVKVVAQARSLAHVDGAVRAATSMSPLEACADARALVEPPPASPGIVAAAADLEGRALALEIAARAGQLDGALAEGAELVAEARALAYAPGLIDALTAQRQILHALDDQLAAAPVLRELIELTGSSHDDRSEATAWLQLITVVGLTTANVDDMRALVPSARAAVLRAGNPVDLRAGLLQSQASVLDRSHRGRDRDDALESTGLLGQERGLLDRAGASSLASPLARQYSSMLHELAIAQARIDPVAAIAAAREAIERWRGLLGADSLEEAGGWALVRRCAQQIGRLDEAVAAAAETTRIREARRGRSPLWRALQSLESPRPSSTGP